MRDPTGQSADRLQLLGLRQRLAGTLQLLLRQPALGDVLGDLGEADELSGVVMDGIDQDVRPKPLARFPDALGLAFEFPVPHRGGESHGWLSC